MSSYSLSFFSPTAHTIPEECGPLFVTAVMSSDPVCTLLTSFIELLWNLIFPILGQ